LYVFVGVSAIFCVENNHDLLGENAMTTLGKLMTSDDPETTLSAARAVALIARRGSGSRLYI